MPIRILLADDHSVVRAGLRTLIKTEPDFDLVGEAADGNQVLQLASQLKPDIVVMDVSMPGLGGIDAMQKLKELVPQTRVLILTFHEDESLVRKAISSGASGYIIKRAAESELINAIRIVSQGDVYIHPSMTRALIRDLIPILQKRPTEPSLTAREIEVLRLIVRGFTNNQIARNLSLSTRTVEGHRASLMDKLNLHSRVELVEWAEQHGLLDLPPSAKNP
jgi:two-component system, NarL family, response regulator NreC